MKIAFIVDVFPSLSQSFVLNQITGLIDLGHEVEILAGSKSIEEKIHPEVKEYKLLNHTHYIHEVPNNIFIRIIRAFILFILNFYKNPLAVIRSLNFFEYGKDALSLHIFYKVVLSLSIGKFDIIQCHFGPSGFLGVLLKELGIKGKVVTTFHGYDLSKYIKQKGEDVYQDLFLKGDLFLPISDFWRNKLIQLGCPKEKIITHRMGIDVEKFKFHPRQLLPGEKLTILTIARLAEKKGLDYSIRTIAKVIKHKPNIEYDIIGDGPLKDELSNLINKLAVESQVKLLGWRVGEELELLLKKAHLFILHSVTDSNGNMEGIPVSLMEAQAGGIPIISTLHSGIPELVQKGKSGFLVPERDIDAMAKRLAYLIRNPEIWLDMGKKGRKNVEDKFNIKKLNQRLVKIYKTLIDSPEEF